MRRGGGGAEEERGGGRHRGGGRRSARRWLSGVGGERDGEWRGGADCGGGGSCLVGFSTSRKGTMAHGLKKMCMFENVRSILWAQKSWVEMVVFFAGFYGHGPCSEASLKYLNPMRCY